jgi:uncharacterized lipoprotein
MSRPCLLRRLALPALLALGLSSCSYIASLFPDKQKQYRYSNELPDLEIPPDIGLPPPGAAERAEERGAERASARRDEGEETPRARPAPRKRPAPKSAANNSTLAQGQGEAPLIEVEEAFAEAWDDANRALGRLELEVVDQNRSDGLYYVYYGGDGKKPRQETGLWSDIKSVFASDESKAREYRVKLVEKGDFTHIYVLDSEGKAVVEGQGLELLQRLHEKLQTLDQPEPESRSRGDAEKPGP